MAFEVRAPYPGDVSPGPLREQTPSPSPEVSEVRSSLEERSDEELVRLVQLGHSEALDVLLDRYRTFVRVKARSYFLVGADREDIVQEGMIGFFKAIRDFRDDRPSSFRAFAEMCVTRQMITAVKTATRQKHLPLNSYVSLDKPIYEDEFSERTLLDVLGDEAESDPLVHLVREEERRELGERLREILSDFEKNVLLLYLDGNSYQEIAERLHRQVKAVDNALQRIKRKLERLLKTNSEAREE
ncbi:RNA polymerase sigma-30 (SigH) subunit [Brockia lithotrophica]|uniref:RNA polymerase sigma factor SigS n=1 Tax=Brockia lithotrophica TaxID=933949 RepID=A0A660KZ11_9BACL|nr:RNA polymerase sporulation sigma factor SigH [Brockia lithotrophica]RKQ85587.1 RNA polymerase sigma-30 (SigH) subunit [Brockia lithotrophica]